MCWIDASGVGPTPIGSLEHGDEIGDLITQAQQVVRGSEPEWPPSPELWSQTSVGTSTPAGQQRTFAVPHLRHCRTRAGLGQAELPQRTGIGRETLARLENGRRARRDVIIRLADALLIAPSELMQSNDLDGTTGDEYRICWSCGVLRFGIWAYAFDQSALWRDPAAAGPTVLVEST